jgi:hypothetical protein
VVSLPLESISSKISRYDADLSDSVVSFISSLFREEAEDKRMYATGTSTCPAKLLHSFLSKTDPKAISLFNECNRDALRAENPETVAIWYSDTPVKQKKISPHSCQIFAKMPKKNDLELNT